MGKLALLQVHKLTVFYENAIALNDFSIIVNKHEIVGVIGSNSAGKTTLMNTLSGLILDMKIKEKRRGGERITIYGKITYGGKDITDCRPEQRVRNGLVLSRERHPIFSESDVLENLRISAHLLKRSKLKTNIDYVFQLFPPLISLKKRKAGFLSGGEQQMLSIAMALITKPELLLLDEPLLGLSPYMQLNLVDAIKKLRDERGLTIVIAEQFARPVLPMIDRGYVMENGMLVLSGTGDELIGNPEVKSAYFGV